MSEEAAKTDVKVETKKDESSTNAQEVAQLKAIAQRYAAVNELYAKNANVKEAIDKAIKGESTEKATEKLSDDEEMDFSAAIKEIKNIKRELHEAKSIASDSKKEIEEAKDAWALEFVTSNAVNIDNKYKEQVRRYADKMGIDSSGKQFKYLYKEVIDNAKEMAKDFNLVDKNGQPNPLMRFEPELIKKAFQHSLKDLEESFNFDPLALKQRRLMEQGRQKEVAKKEEIKARAKELAEQGFTGRDIRTRLMEEQFNKAIRNAGTTREEVFRYITRGEI